MATGQAFTRQGMRSSSGLIGDECSPHVVESKTLSATRAFIPRKQPADPTPRYIQRIVGYCARLLNAELFLTVHGKRDCVLASFLRERAGNETSAVRSIIQE